MVSVNTMDPLTMTREELDAMAVLATQFSAPLQPHLPQVVLAVELAAIIEPTPAAGDLDKEATGFAKDFIQEQIRAPAQLAFGFGEFE